ncbi:hypothetical protein N1028_13890 [Herbiconiux sp. CPCC 203407]|uniref:Integral membrane protein n=1 Tax=Herbiconiux oxytropis TaxID=2970915 RepID=A0AA41XI07_9MICO|nr:hypothetical protein [Herbiconiux oxytropis]MCS5724079.1 hypothetical protein [Herbiconiux oxytropis]MCS5726988.1 hypothetical protein [Herbiconiux oxytropis]
MAAQERDVERWLRAVGLPLFVRKEALGDRLVSRVVPFMVFALVAGLFVQLGVDADIDVELDSTMIVALLVGSVLIVGVAFVAVPIVLGMLSARVLRAHPRAALPTGIVVLVCYLVVLPGVTALTSPLGEAAWHAGVHLLIVAVAVLLTWLGVGSLLAWAAHAALRQLTAIGALVTRALPILMLVVVFAFFSKPLWDVTSTMSPARLVAVALFFLVLGLLFVIPVSRVEMKELDESMEQAERIRLVQSSGLAELDGYASTPGPPLARRERVNLQAVLVLALVLQTLVFAAIVCVFLIVLGSFAFSQEVLQAWVGDRLTMVELFGVEVPFTWALVKTSIFLSCVSSLNFLVSVTTNAAYRTAFFHPLIHDARAGLAVRAAYLRRHEGVAADAAAGIARETDEPAAAPFGESAG